MNKIQIFNLKGQSGFIFSIDYDYEKDVIISGSFHGDYLNMELYD